MSDIKKRFTDTETEVTKYTLSDLGRLVNMDLTKYHKHEEAVELLLNKLLPENLSQNFMLKRDKEVKVLRLSTCRVIQPIQGQTWLFTQQVKFL